MHQATGVDRVKSVDVLFGVDEFENFAFVDVLWQRQLDENAIDIMAFVQLSNDFNYLFPRRVGFEMEMFRDDAEFLRGSHFAADIDCRRWVFADADDD